MNETPHERVVAHVVDRVSGGVPVAVRTYIQNSPSGYSHVVISPWRDGAPSSVWSGLSAAHLAWDTSTVSRAVRGLRRVLRRHTFDVVHAHSSFPGAYVRMVSSRRRTRIVYTPHCFAFVRTDISAPQRAVFRLAERALRHRTGILAACGAGERREAERLGFRPERVLVVPNLASVPTRDGSRRARGLRVPNRVHIGMLGRWSEQKDPAAFIASAVALRRALPGMTVDATWIGDGQGTTPRPDGVEVTGWLDRAAVGERLDDLDVYVHSAAWEGFPIAILDAAAVGLPILTRRIDALPDLPAALTIDGGLADLADAVRSDRFDAWSSTNRSRWAEYLGPRDSDDQRRALAGAWG